MISDAFFFSRNTKPETEMLVERERKGLFHATETGVFIAFILPKTVEMDIL